MLRTDSISIAVATPATRTGQEEEVLFLSGIVGVVGGHVGVVVGDFPRRRRRSWALIYTIPRQAESEYIARKGARVEEGRSHSRTNVRIDIVHTQTRSSFFDGETTQSSEVLFSTFQQHDTTLGTSA